MACERISSLVQLLAKSCCQIESLKRSKYELIYITLHSMQYISFKIQIRVLICQSFWCHKHLIRIHCLSKDKIIEIINKNLSNRRKQRMKHSTFSCVCIMFSFHAKQCKFEADAYEYKSNSFGARHSNWVHIQTTM